MHQPYPSACQPAEPPRLLWRPASSAFFKPHSTQAL
jgi:hypothetical protein